MEESKQQNLTTTHNETRPSVLQEIVDYWGEHGNNITNNQLSERDILSLFETLDGHFISRTGDAAKEEVRDEPKIIDCNECGKMFSTQLNLQKHKQLHANKEVFSCTKCSKKFMSRSGLSKHMSKHVVDMRTCSHCDQQFTSEEYLEQHMKLHNSERYGKTY